MMSFKEIAETAGCSVRTARRYAKVLWPERSFQGKLGASLNEQDAKRLMDLLPKRNRVESGQPAGQLSALALAGQSGQLSAPLTMQDLVTVFPAMFAEALRQMVPLLREALGVEQKPRQTLLPEISARKQVSNVVTEYLYHRNGGKRPAVVVFENAYKKLYKNFGDRYGVNVMKQAENRGIKPIELLEREGKMEELFLCSLILFGDRTK